MCKISESLVASISFLPAEQREMVLANFRQSMRDYEGQKIVGYLPKDRSADHRKVSELHHDGMSIKAIAKLMRMCRKTVRKVVRGGVN
jgi:DNA-binding NarL/FixJ family response regulator